MSAPPDPGRRPLLVELVGLPGAGKSTVYDALRAREPGIARPPVLRRGRPLLLARHLAATLAVLARRRALGRHWSRDGVVMMAYLQALPRALGGPHPAGARAIVFDQGPIYTLTRPALRDPRLADRWEAAVAAWRPLLDAVVWLDAPDEVLAARIDARAKEHRLKGDARAAATLAGERERYESVLARFEGGPRVLRIDTGARSADEAVAQIAGLIGSA